MNADLQRLQDMLAAMQSQRDQALNAHVVQQAEIAALRRTVAERDAQIKQLQDDVAKLTPEPVAEAAE
jgi:cell division protein FtsB